LTSGLSFCSREQPLWARVRGFWFWLKGWDGWLDALVNAALSIDDWFKRAPCDYGCIWDEGVNMWL